jgi:pimeloyl-ACP methyl ester carboxylesterase
MEEHMLFKEFGNKNKPVIILLHGGGVSCWSLEPQIEKLQEDYFIVTPIIDGHGDDWNNTFISIENSAEKVINYIKVNCDGKVFAICGLSLGAQIIVEMLSQEVDITENAVIESALVYPMKIATKLTVPAFSLFFGLAQKRWFAKLQAKTLNIPDDLFETYYRDSSRMTKETLVNITKSNGNYSASPKLCKTKAKTLIIVGEKELSIMRKSAKLLQHTINNSTLEVIKNGKHGEISLAHSDRYVNLLENFFAKNID